jgi:hypothetical protein
MALAMGVPSVEVMKNMLNANFNDIGQAPTKVIAGMNCKKLKNGENLQVGDIAYMYSRQLDSFGIYEVFRIIGPPGPQALLAFMQLIDNNRAELWKKTPDRIQPYVKEDHLFTYWRPDPKDRKRVKEEGFKSKGYSRFSVIPRRQLVA